MFLLSKVPHLDHGAQQQLREEVPLRVAASNLGEVASDGKKQVYHLFIFLLPVCNNGFADVMAHSLCGCAIYALRFTVRNIVLHRSHQTLCLLGVFCTSKSRYKVNVVEDLQEKNMTHREDVLAKRRKHSTSSTSENNASTNILWSIACS